MKKWLQQVTRGFWGVNRGLLVIVVVVFLLIGLVPSAVLGGWLWFYQDRVYPGVRVAGVDLSHQREAEALRVLDVLERDFLANKSLRLRIYGDDQASASAQAVSVGFDEVDLSFDPAEGVKKAMARGRGGEWWENLRDQLALVREGADLKHEYSVNEEALKEFVLKVAQEVDRPGAKAQVSLEKDGVEIFPGENGWVLDQQRVIDEMLEVLERLGAEQIEVALSQESNELSEEMVERVETRAERLRGKALVVELDLEGKVSDQSWRLKDEDLVGWISFEGGFERERVEEYVTTLAEAVNREAQNAQFKFEGGRVLEFSPALKGVVINESGSVGRIMDALVGVESSENDGQVKLAVWLTEPSVQTKDVNDLGIKELLGRGSSTFRGSIPGRIHNVALTASRLHGILIEPGEVFSFNGTIGDVSSATGYQSAYIISGGRTILGDGGGVCQDSTTLFRAILDAGLPIVERRAHSYRVGYYEQNSQPGYDATVYAPNVDLKFKNDTPAHILIQAFADTRTLGLVVELYGTSDGRVARTENYQKWGAVPAPPPLYQDDPTLPAGTVKQIDWAAAGLKTKFDYVVMRGGEKIFEKTFYSNFRPWQAVYLKGTG